MPTTWHRQEFTAPHTPEQIGIAEGMSQTIQERIVTMIKHSGLKDGFFAEALLTTVHIINMSPSIFVGYNILQELWFGKISDYRKLRFSDARIMLLSLRMNTGILSHGH